MANRKRQIVSADVRATRAGDLFHYRWAATRVLNLLNPKLGLTSVYVEGGATPSKFDYIVDVCEAYVDKDVYYQLKYSTKHSSDAFTLSFLGETLEKFGKHYKSLRGRKDHVEYVFLTNRPASEDVKNCVEMAATDPSALDRINRYLGFDRVQARSFCRRFRIIDCAEDSRCQMQCVECRLSALLCSQCESNDARALVQFVAERAAERGNEITQASLLSLLGCSCEEDLFPARSDLSVPGRLIYTEQCANAIRGIVNSEERKIVVHAPGGVGKTALVQYLQQEQVLNGEAVLYDCFGGGLYRSSNCLRHRVRDGFVEIANELYAKGLCDPILKWRNAPDEAIVDLFWNRVRQSVRSLRSEGIGRQLYLLIDAADNAVMAATESASSSSFVRELITAEIPDGCKVVFTARTERLGFASAVRAVCKIELSGFNAHEVGVLIQDRISATPESELSNAVWDFTKGNPRVIQNLLAQVKDIEELRAALATSSPNTVPALVERKIAGFVDKLKDGYSRIEQDQLHRLFDALAILPPTIPIDVLAGVTGVDRALIESLVAEFGQSFWYEHDLIHFRDEPTEDYFRSRYGQTAESKKRVLAELEKQTAHGSYAALAVPCLLFALQEYDRLFALAESKSGLPDVSATEVRRLWLTRLEYAYRAALRLKRFPNVISLAFLLAAEDNGDARQNNLMLDHLPFIARRSRLEEMEFLCRDRELAWAWNGSHNLVSAVLKAVRNRNSSAARMYLQISHDWMWEAFEKFKRGEKGNQIEACPDESQIALMALVIYCVRGLAALSEFVGMWRPFASRFKIARFLALDMVSLGEMDDLVALSGLMAADPAVNLAWNLILEENGKAIGNAALRTVISFLKSKEPIASEYLLPRQDYFTHSVMAACEAAARDASLSHAVPNVLKKRILSRNGYYARRNFEERNFVFLKAYALWLVTSGSSHDNCDFESLLDKRYRSRNDYDKRSASQEIAARIQFFISTEKFLVSSCADAYGEVLTGFESIVRGYEIRDWERWEFGDEWFRVRSLAKIKGLDAAFLNRPEEWSFSKISWVRKIDVARRLTIAGFCKEAISGLENVHQSMTDSRGEEEVDQISERLMEMAEIAYDTDKTLSDRYYEQSLSLLSAVGDEALQHFAAIQDLMRRACETRVAGDVAIRFLRCAEHAYRYDSKHFDPKGAFEVLAKNNMADALSALSRFRDRGFGDFSYVLQILLQGLVCHHGFSCQEVWPMRFLLDGRERIKLLDFILSKGDSNDVGQDCLDSCVDELAKSTERIDDDWQELSKIAKRYALDDRMIRPYVRVLSGRRDGSSTRLSRNRTNEKRIIDKALQAVSYSSPTWLVDYHRQASRAFAGRRERKMLLDSLPDGQFANLLEQLAVRDGLCVWDVAAYLDEFPKEKLGKDWATVWNSGVRKIITRFISENDIKYLRDLVRHLSDSTSRQETFAECLSSASETISVSAGHCYDVIAMASWLVSPAEAAGLAAMRIQSFEAELGKSLGDPPALAALDETVDIHDVLAGVLWSALGSPVAWYRWNATYCVSSMVEHGCQQLVEGLCKCSASFDVQQFLTAGATFYDGFAEMYFAIAINHSAAVRPKSILNLARWLEDRTSACQNVIIRWYYTEALAKSSRKTGTPSEETLSNLRNRILPHTPPIRVDSWSGTLDYAWDNEIAEGYHCTAEYDVVKYWLPGLARVFGIAEKPFESLFEKAFRKIAARYEDWPRRMRYDYDTREYRNEVVLHSHGEYPRAFAFGTYVAFMALGELAFELIGRFPIVIHAGDGNCNAWSKWLREHLLERMDGFWLSDERDPVPYAFVSDDPFVGELDKNTLGKSRVARVFDIASPMRGGVPIGGSWETSAGSKRLKVKFHCVLVPKGAADGYLQKLRGYKGKYGYAIPSVYSDWQRPEFKAKGKWCGILQSDGYSDATHFEPYDPNYGGFDRNQIMVATEIQNLLKVDRADFGKVLRRGKGVIARLVRWGTGEDVWRRRSPVHVGSVLWMTRQALLALEKSLQCEIIIGAHIEREDAYRDRGSSYVEPECAWAWKKAKVCKC